MSGNRELLESALARAAAEDRAALIAYLPGGFPTVDGGIEAVKAVVAGGADIVEVGLPHSDPVLDGPVIQTADDIALRGGVRIADIMRTVREAHEATGVPVLVMTYWNPIDRYGVERFTAELAEAGGAGCILPDLPVQESALWREHAEKHSLATVFVVAPSSRDARLAAITAAAPASSTPPPSWASPVPVSRSASRPRNWCGEPAPPRTCRSVSASACPRPSTRGRSRPSPTA